jgi:hypothetical protein
MTGTIAARVRVHSNTTHKQLAAAIFMCMPACRAAQVQAEVEAVGVGSLLSHVLTAVAALQHPAAVQGDSSQCLASRSCHPSIVSTSNTCS